ncbi:unnamed protein product [Cercospora beticola]|nr:unnamed protein product [Cercospora beticola]
MSSPANSERLCSLASISPLSQRGTLSESVHPRTSTISREVGRLGGRAHLSLSTTDSRFTRTPQTSPKLYWLYGSRFTRVIPSPAASQALPISPESYFTRSPPDPPTKMPASLRRSTKAKSRALAELDVNTARMPTREPLRKRRKTTPSPVEAELSKAGEDETYRQDAEHPESDDDDDLIQDLDTEEVQELTAPPRYVNLLEQRELVHLKPLCDMPEPKTRVHLSRNDLSAFKVIKIASGVPFDLPSQRRILYGLMEDSIAQHSMSNNRPMNLSIIQDRIEHHYYKEMDEMLLDVVAIVDDFSLPSEAPRPILCFSSTRNS